MIYFTTAVASAVVALILDFGIAEVVMLLALAAFARSPRAQRSRLPSAWMHLVRRIACRPTWAYGSILLLAIVPRALFFATTGPSAPFVPDEFSYLLLADTLESGRLTNPVHPHWEFFETVHVLPKPTYQSQYMPGTAVFLAVGKIIFGHPLFGVWLTTVLLFISLLWGLRQWLSPTWAWFATALATVRFGIGSYWVDSYWGGAVPALGGTLLLGSVAAMVTGRRVSWQQGLAFGAGSVLLLSTRPWEGAALGLGCCAVLLWALLRRRQELGRFSIQFALPAVSTFLLGALALAGYTAAVTGSPGTLPYRVNQDLYGWPMTLPWMHPGHPEFHQSQMRLYHRWETKEHSSVTTLSGFFLQTPLKMVTMWRFFFGPMLTVLLWALFRHRRWRGWPFLFLCALPVFLAVALEQTWYPHYLAPAFAAVVGVWAIGMRELHKRSRSVKGSGAAFAGWFLAFLIPAHFVLLGAGAVSRAAAWPYQPGENPVSWCCLYGGPLDRAKAEREILNAGGRGGLQSGGSHLVFISTPQEHYNPVQWTYNRADIDASQIVWAWDLGAERNQELLRYYPGRKPWRVFADRNGYLLLPYETPFPDLKPRLMRLNAKPNELDHPTLPPMRPEPLP